MNATFRSRRKAVKIQVDEDEDVADNLKISSTETSSALHSVSLPSLDPDSQKKKIPKYDEVGINKNKNDNVTSNSINNFTDGDGKYEQITGFKKKEKKNKKLSKLSFGLSDNTFEETINSDSENQLRDTIKFPKKGVKQASKFRKGVSLKSLPVHFSEAHKERPTYSKDYLNELKNSTPVIRSQVLDDPQYLIEERDQDSPIDFQGSLITATQSGAAIIPTEAEIREKKERRARLAREADFISFDEDINDRRILLPQSVKTESRLVRDDEDFAEGFDEFVEDERIALGNKQERQARRRKRKEIAEMIQQAEASSDAESDDSEVERCTAYENAQTRAGMDGLQRNEIEEESIEERMPTNITPLPILSECLARFQNRLNSMEFELEQQKKKLLEAEQEERDIATRELEVQALLSQAGEQLEAMSSGLLDMVQDPTSIPENS